MGSQKTFIKILLLILVFVDGAGFGLVYPLFSTMLFQSETKFFSMDITPAVRGQYIGLLLSILPLTQFLSAPVFGMISDYKGRKPILCKTLLVGIGGYFIAIFGSRIESFLTLLFSRVLLGISAGNAAVIEASLADISTGNEKARNFGLFNMAYGIGFTIGPFLGSICSQPPIGTFDTPFLIMALAMLCNLILLFFFFEETAPQKEGGGKVTIWAGIQNIGKAVRYSSFRPLFFSAFAFCFGWAFYWEFAPATWSELYALSLSQVGVVYAYGAVFYAISCGIFIRPLMQKYDLYSLLFYSLILTGVSIASIFVCSTSQGLWLCIPFQQFLLSLLFPSITTIVSNSTTEDAQGETLGILQSVICLSWGLGPLISGTMLQMSLHMPVIIGTFSMILASIALGIGRKEEIFRKAQSEKTSF